MGKMGKGWGREGLRGRLFECHRMPPPPLVGEQRWWPRGLAGEGASAAAGVAPESPGGNDAGRVWGASHINFRVI